MGAKNHAVIMPDGKCLSMFTEALADWYEANKNLALNSLVGAAFGG
jgi:hypothetical protein